MQDAGGKTQIEPQVPGYYLWYILDFGYLEVGVVQVMKDPESHLEYLRGKSSTQYYIYQNEAGETLTMYHQAWGGSRPHLPPVDENNRPLVDLYVTFDMENLPIRKLDFQHPFIPEEDRWDEDSVVGPILRRVHMVGKKEPQG